MAHSQIVIQHHFDASNFRAGVLRWAGLPLHRAERRARIRPSFRRGLHKATA